MSAGKKGCEQDISLSAVITKFRHFSLVEKVGEAGEIAEQLASSG